MTPREEILTELQGISQVVADLPRVDVFEVPKGYFEGLPARLGSLAQELRESTTFGMWNEDTTEVLGRFRVNVFDDPGRAYFDGFAGSVMQRIGEEEKTSVIPNRENGSALSAGGDSAMSNIVPVIKLTRGRRKFFYAAAALITGVLAIGYWIFLERGTTRNEYASRSVIAPKPLPGMDSIALRASDADLMTYLDVTIDAPSMENSIRDQSVALLDMNETTLREYLDEIPVEAIQEYIEEYPDTRYAPDQIN